MNDIDLNQYRDRAGSIEIVVLLSESERQRQELIRGIRASESAIDNRLEEGRRLGVIEPVATVSSSSRYRLADGFNPREHIPPIYFKELLPYTHSREIHRDDLNNSSNDGGHTDAPGGSSITTNWK
ncbi:hypothetical protein [Natronorubrum texcoconense]|uniref:hypothetical protein n=1 Tax=Natronorubrum texcoconense TaxID=1095776 RepID=UPI00111397D2|nr:hypothetical protein [Natronorubrum texcoconense]